MNGEITMNELPPEVCRRKCFLINLAYVCAIAGIVILVLRYALSDRKSVV